MSVSYETLKKESNDRAVKVAILRANKMSLTEIGEGLGVGANRAGQIAMYGKRLLNGHAWWGTELHWELGALLNRNGFNSKTEVRDALISRYFVFTPNGLLETNIHMLGKEELILLCNWCDIEPNTIVDDKIKAESALISELPFLQQTINCLNNANITTVMELLAITDKDLRKIPNLSINASNSEIKKVLASRGLSLKKTEPTKGNRKAYVRKINLTPELARLLNFTARVATAIRMYSDYNQRDLHPGGKIIENAPEDLMWLSDSLHNLDRLGRAVQEVNPANIMSACDALLSSYADYQVEDPLHSRQAKPSFERNSNIFSLSEGIEVFTAIKAKVLPLVQSI